MKIRIPHNSRGRLVLGSGLCLVVALLAAFLSVNSVSLLPPHAQPRALTVGGASTRVIVDMPRSIISDSRAQVDDVDTLNRRAVLFASLATSEDVLAYIGRKAGIDPSQIAGVTRITANVPTVLTEPDSERRAADIAAAKKPYRVEIQPSQNLPAFNVFTQAPSVPEALRLADATAPALRDYLRDLALRRGDDPAAQVRLSQLGPARGGVVSGRSKPMIAFLAFMLALSLSAAALLAAGRLTGRARTRRATPARVPVPDARERPARRSGSGWGVPVPAGFTPAVAAGTAGGVALPRLPAARVRSRSTGLPRRLATDAGDWPRTTRALPWMIAVMLAVIWLVPFNSIVLQASLPIDLKFDRLVLPFLVITGILSLAAGGPGAPRLRFTWIHAAIAAVIVVACISLVLDATSLNRTLELEAGIKKLALLASYAALFLVVSSSVRKREVPAFMTYTLVLAVICAIGTIWEYRFQYNVFYSMSDKLLGGVFEVTNAAESASYDDIGRRIVQGPAEIPLEAVAMMVMALPIAFVGMMHATRLRGRILYGLAACLLLAAMIATARKSAFLAPVAVVLTLAYFRRGELLKLAPIALVLLVLVHVLAPGALGGIAFQLRGDRLGVNTVSDRTSDYDAIRPDVWTHLAFGRGYGTYEHQSYRILDMELLHELVEVGMIGLAAYLLMVVAVLAVARAPIRSRRPPESQIALAVAAAAVAFLVVSTLFDVMSFPHCPYIFLWLAALLTVATGPDPDDERGPPPARPEEPAWSS